MLIDRNVRSPFTRPVIIFLYTRPLAIKFTLDGVHHRSLTVLNFCYYIYIYTYTYTYIYVYASYRIIIYTVCPSPLNSIRARCYNRF